MLASKPALLYTFFAPQEKIRISLFVISSFIQDEGRTRASLSHTDRNGQIQKELKTIKAKAARITPSRSRIFIRIEASGKKTCLESSRLVFRASGREDLSTRLRIISGLSNPSASLPFCFAIFFSRFLWSYCLQFVTFHSLKFTYFFP